MLGLGTATFKILPIFIRHFYLENIFFQLVRRFSSPLPHHFSHVETKAPRFKVPYQSSHSQLIELKWKLRTPDSQTNREFFSKLSWDVKFPWLKETLWGRADVIPNENNLTIALWTNHSSLLCFKLKYTDNIFGKFRNEWGNI